MTINDSHIPRGGSQYVMCVALLNGNSIEIEHNLYRG
jgi:hypothetical protein